MLNFLKTHRNFGFPSLLAVPSKQNMHSGSLRDILRITTDRINVYLLLLILIWASQTGLFAIGPTQARAFDKPHGLQTFSVLAMQETLGARAGRYHRVKLIETDFKYPLLRVEELVEDTPHGRTIQHQRMMVGNHVIVRLRKGVDAEQFARNYGYKIKRKLILPEVYLFEVPSTLEEFPAVLKS